MTQPELIRSKYSETGQRLMLCDFWDTSRTNILFIDLVPPNEEREKYFTDIAKSHKFGGIYLCSVFPCMIDSPSDDQLIASGSAENDMTIMQSSLKCSTVVFAWDSTLPQTTGRDLELFKIIKYAPTMYHSKIKILKRQTDLLSRGPLLLPYPENK